jgi:hypothetical protein
MNQEIKTETKVFPDVPLEIDWNDAYYWMDDHIEVACATLDQSDVLPYNGKHSFCPGEVRDTTVNSPFGFFEALPHDVPFHRLPIDKVNTDFKATLLLLGINYERT